jgi:hypothetical protein
MRDQVTSDAGIPLLTFIIEALNQDYKRYYPGDYQKTSTGSTSTARCGALGQGC